MYVISTLAGNFALEDGVEMNGVYRIWRNLKTRIHGSWLNHFVFSREKYILTLKNEFETIFETFKKKMEKKKMRGWQTF